MNIQVTCLADWLRSCVHGDVLVPVDAATKIPLVRHADGAWTWSKFHKFRTENPNHSDFAVALQTLCVVDVDCHAAAAALEARFPVLASDDVPVEATRKGRHYFFTRSALCDTDGFYDARAPCMPGVDFKTRSSTGTGGIVLVAPSVGKSWCGTPPWKALQTIAPREIPEDLLRSVAAPKHPPQPLSFSCADGQIVRRGACRYASRAAYVGVYANSHAVFSDTGHSSAGIPVGTFSAASVEAAIDSVEACDAVTVHAREHETVVEALEFLDYICAPEKQLSRVRKLTRQMLELDAIDHAAHVAYREDIVNDMLLPVDEALSARLRHESVVLGDSEIRLCARDFQHEIDPSSESDGESVSDPSRVLVCDPVASVERRLPSCVTRWMRSFPKRLVVAGGFVTGAVVRAVTEGSDIDLFVVAETAAEADPIVREILDDADVTDATFTGCALTLTVRGTPRPVQLVAFLIPTPEQIVLGFDFDPARAMALVDASGVLNVCATRTWVRAAQTLAFRVDPEGWSASAILRVSKYCAKGYRAFIPGLDREKVDAHLQRHRLVLDPTSRGLHAVSPLPRSRVSGRVARLIGEDPGLGSLFLAEWLAQRLGVSGRGRWYCHRRLCESARGARACDYGSLISASGGWAHAMRGARRIREWVRSYWSSTPVDSRFAERARGTFRRGHETDASKVYWRKFAPEKRLRAVHALVCDVDAWCVERQ